MASVAPLKSCKLFLYDPRRDILIHFQHLTNTKPKTRISVFSFHFRYRFIRFDLIPYDEVHKNRNNLCVWVGISHLDVLITQQSCHILNLSLDINRASRIVSVSNRNARALAKVSNQIKRLLIILLNLALFLSERPDRPKTADLTSSVERSSDTYLSLYAPC